LLLVNELTGADDAIDGEVRERLLKLSHFGR